MSNLTIFAILCVTFTATIVCFILPMVFYVSDDNIKEAKKSGFDKKDNCMAKTLKNLSFSTQKFDVLMKKLKIDLPESFGEISDKKNTKLFFNEKLNNRNSMIGALGNYATFLEISIEEGSDKDKSNITVTANHKEFNKVMTVFHTAAYLLMMLPLFYVFSAELTAFGPSHFTASYLAEYWYLLLMPVMYYWASWNKKHTFNHIVKNVKKHATAMVE
ncbi:MAG: hypothetical protein GY804_13530 [Alphaproteobacteria bacterium]|nr:hypothetical protein [Alphaproteobacteria bacterium]